MAESPHPTRSSRILSLAKIIASESEVVDKFLQDKNLPQPSFETDALLEPIPDATPDVSKAQNTIIEATIELRQLLEGPVKALLPESNFAPLAAVYRYKIANFVPTNNSISFPELASKCGLLEHDLKRIIRYTAIFHRVFQEVTSGFVSHTAASKLLAENEQIGNVMGLTLAECWPAHSRTVDAIAQKSEEPNVTGYALANGTELNTFDFLNANPERAKRFAGAMSMTSKASLDALATYFDWASLAEGSVVVDIGGSRGHVSADLAKRFPQLRFVVQDMPEVVKGAEEGLPEEVANLVSFASHDMFTEQPVRGAEVYLLRYVLHDWPDKYCVEVLKQLFPALKKGAKVVIQDHLLPEPGSLGMLPEMRIRSMDAIMLTLFNSREREAYDWKTIFEKADTRFIGFNAERIKENPTTGLIVATWAG